MSDLLQLEHQLEDAKILAARRLAALRLAENRDFRDLILEDYLVKEAARCIQAAGDDKLTPQQRADLVEMGKATGYLKRFLHAITTMGGTAENDIPALEEAIAEARLEEDNLAANPVDLESDSQIRGGVLN